MKSERNGKALTLLKLRLGCNCQLAIALSLEATGTERCRLLRDAYVFMTLDQLLHPDHPCPPPLSSSLW